MRDAGRPEGPRGQISRLVLRLRPAPEARSRLNTAVNALAIGAVVQILRAKFWLTRMLIRGTIRFGVSMYQSRVTALVPQARPGSAVAVPEPELLVAQRRLQRFVSRLLAAKLTFALLAGALTLSYTNPYTPPGFEGYVYEHPRVLGAGGFRVAQTGPANYGVSFWNNKVINIDIRPDTHDETFQTVTRDDLTVTLRLSAVFSIVPGHVTEIVNEYGGENWYPRFIQPRMRSLVQSSVGRRSSLELNAQRRQIEDEVRDGLTTYLRGMPFVLCDLSETDLAFPQGIAQAAQRKLEARQLLDEKVTQVEIARRNAEIDIAVAQGQSEAQRLMAATLTPLYLQHESIKADVKKATGPARTVVYVPVGPSGVPLIRELPRDAAPTPAPAAIPAVTPAGIVGAAAAAPVPARGAAPHPAGEAKP